MPIEFKGCEWLPTVAQERLPNEYQLHTRARKQVEAKRLSKGLLAQISSESAAVACYRFVIIVTELFCNH